MKHQASHHSEIKFLYWASWKSLPELEMESTATFSEFALLDTGSITAQIKLFIQLKENKRRIQIACIQYIIKGN